MPHGMDIDGEQLRKTIEVLRSLAQETEWVEFKENRLDSARVGRYVSALSNGACLSGREYGWLVLGISDGDHTVKGTKLRFSTMRVGNEDLEFHLRKRLHPCPEFGFQTLMYEGKHIEVLRVAAALGQPVMYDKTPYGRINSNTTELTNYPDKLRAIYNSRDDWFIHICEGATIEHLDPEAIAVARKIYKAKARNLPDDFDMWDEATFLQKMRLMREDGITRAAVLLLGKDTSSYLLSPIVAEITWKLEYADERAYEHFGLPFILSPTKILHKLRNYTVKLFADNSLIPREVSKYDVEVVSEALHNCIAHQDYTQGARIIVSEYEDRLVFRNVGNFFSRRPQDYFTGSVTPDRYRNKFLAESMGLLGMVDSMGYGIHKMYDKQKSRFLPLPDYELRHDPEAVELTIYGKPINENYCKVLIEHADLSLDEVIALDYIQKGKSLPESVISLLRKKHLVEGRKPHLYLARSIALLTGEKAKYIDSIGVDRDLIKEHIIKSIRRVASMSRADINAIVGKLLPANLSERQKYDTVSRLIKEMSLRDRSIRNIGKSTKGAKWAVSEK